MASFGPLETQQNGPIAKRGSIYLECLAVDTGALTHLWELFLEIR